jgi:hypothetical protein
MTVRARRALEFRKRLFVFCHGRGASITFDFAHSSSGAHLMRCAAPAIVRNQWLVMADH